MTTLAGTRSQRTSATSVYHARVDDKLYHCRLGRKIQGYTPLHRTETGQIALLRSQMTMRSGSTPPCLPLQKGGTIGPLTLTILPPGARDIYTH